MESHRATDPFVLKYVRMIFKRVNASVYLERDLLVEVLFFRARIQGGKVKNYRFAPGVGLV